MKKHLILPGNSDKNPTIILRERCEFLERENASLHKENVFLKERVQSLEEKIIILMARIDKLENQLKKDSSNSSNPPSSDMIKENVKKNQSLREKSGKPS